MLSTSSTTCKRCTPISISRTMSSNPSLPDDPRLQAIAKQIDESRFGAMMLDPGWNLVWVSEEMRKFLFQPPYEPLYGKHVVENYMSDAFCRLVSEETQLEMLAKTTPYTMWGTEGGKEGFKKIVAAAHDEYFALGRPVPQWAQEQGLGHEQTLALLMETLDTMEPVEPPPIWIDKFEFLYEDLPPTEVAEVQIKLIDETGEIYGYLALYMPALPTSLLQLVARGDEGMFERMMDLVQPGRNPAAIVFC